MGGIFIISAGILSAGNALDAHFLLCGYPFDISLSAETYKKRHREIHKEKHGRHLPQAGTVFRGCNHLYRF